MNRRITLFAALALSGLSALAASAQTVKPGLWESNNKVGSGDGMLQQAMAALQSLPPEQRKKMEEMMSRQGVTMTAGGGVSAKMCITKEMAEQHQLPIQQQGNCRYERAPIAGNSMKFSFSCTNPQASGEGSISFDGERAYSGSMTISSSATGKPETVTVQTSGRWLAADCGSVKPAIGAR